MKKLTELETTVLNAGIEICYEEYGCDANDLAAFTGLNIETVKGVMGSLFKKGYMDEGEGCAHVTDRNGIAISFGLDTMTIEEMTDEVKGK